LESPDEQEKLASYLKNREAEGVTAVHFYFPNNLDASTQTTNHMVVDVAGFSSGVTAPLLQSNANRRNSSFVRRAARFQSTPYRIDNRQRQSFRDIILLLR
jgi:hypothetical protein